MPAFRPAYLICGDDHGRITERRTRLRAMAESESGAGGVEVLEGDLCTPEAVEIALTTMTFAMGRRFVIADGVERWKDGDVAAIASCSRSASRARASRVVSASASVASGSAARAASSSSRATRARLTP